MPRQPACAERIIVPIRLPSATERACRVQAQPGPPGLRPTRSADSRGRRPLDAERSGALVQAAALLSRRGLNQPDTRRARRADLAPPASRARPGLRAAGTWRYLERDWNA